MRPISAARHYALAAMWWMWIVGPIAVGLLFVLTAQTNKRRLQDAEVFRKAAHLKLVKSAPTTLAPAFEEAGGGSLAALYEILPKLAYFGLYDADVSSGSEHQTVVTKLAKRGPTFVAHPLPIVDGQRSPNRGVAFPKDPEFAEQVLVEGSEEKPIRTWLRANIRDTLLEHPDVWLRVQGDTMAVTIYGALDAEGLTRLLEVADSIFAEHGPEDAPSLLYEDDDAPAKPKDKVSKRADEDEPDASAKAAPKKAATGAKPDAVPKATKPSKGA
jgi:hypothetical protein